MSQCVTVTQDGQIVSFTGTVPDWLCNPSFYLRYGVIWSDYSQLVRRLKFCDAAYATYCVERFHNPDLERCTYCLAELTQGERHKHEFTQGR